MTKALTVKKTGWWEYRDVLKERENFSTYGKLKGRSGPAGWEWGRLPYDYRESVKRADYVVYSYSTPIAWHVPGEGWVVPDEKYSVTTTIHQNKIRVAVAELEWVGA